MCLLGNLLRKFRGTKLSAPEIIQDILNNDKYPEQTPMQLYNDPFYHADLAPFGLTKFRKHLHQEIYKREKLISKVKYKKKSLRAGAPIMLPEELFADDIKKAQQEAQEGDEIEDWIL